MKTLSLSSCHLAVIRSTISTAGLQRKKFDFDTQIYAYIMVLRNQSSFSLITPPSSH